MKSKKIVELIQNFALILALHYGIFYSGLIPDGFKFITFIIIIAIYGYAKSSTN